MHVRPLGRVLYKRSDSATVHRRVGAEVITDDLEPHAVLSDGTGDRQVDRERSCPLPAISVAKLFPSLSFCKSDWKTIQVLSILG